MVPYLNRYAGTKRVRVVGMTAATGRVCRAAAVAVQVWSVYRCLHLNSPQSPALLGLCNSTEPSNNNKFYL